MHRSIKAYRGMRLWMVVVLIGGVEVYGRFITPYFFAAAGDTEALLFFVILSYLSSRFWLAPLVFRQAKGYRWRLPLLYLLQILLLLLLGAALSLATGAMTWETDSFAISNWIPVVSTLFVSNFFGMLMYLWRSGISEWQLVVLERERLKMPTHFLLNTMAMLRVLLKTDAKGLETALNKMLRILKFYLQASQQADIALHEELQQVYTLIDIYRLRLQREVYIRFQYATKDIEKTAFPPMLLLHLVENICQYGITDLSAAPALVQIDRDDKGRLAICSKNRIRAGHIAGTIQTNTALKSIRQQIDILDPHTGEFTVRQDPDWYEIRIAFRFYG